MAMITRRHPERPAPEGAWRQMPVKVFLRADESGNPTHLRFRLENGDEHVTPLPAENESLRALAEEFCGTLSPGGRCSRWFG